MTRFGPGIENLSCASVRFRSALRLEWRLPGYPIQAYGGLSRFTDNGRRLRVLVFEEAVVVPFEDWAINKKQSSTCSRCPFRKMTLIVSRRPSVRL
jgi:hypothetical protein